MPPTTTFRVTDRPPLLRFYADYIDAEGEPMVEPIFAPCVHLGAIRATHVPGRRVAFVPRWDTLMHDGVAISAGQLAAAGANADPS